MLWGSMTVIVHAPCSYLLHQNVVFHIRILFYSIRHRVWASNVVVIDLLCDYEWFDMVLRTRLWWADELICFKLLYSRIEDGQIVLNHDHASSNSHETVSDALAKPSNRSSGNSSSKTVTRKNSRSGKRNILSIHVCYFLKTCISSLHCLQHMSKTQRLIVCASITIYRGWSL